MLEWSDVHDGRGLEWSDVVGGACLMCGAEPENRAKLIVVSV